MANIEFMDTKFSVKSAFESMSNDVNGITNLYTLSSIDQQKLSKYLKAILTIKNAGVMDIVKCAVSFGRNLSGTPAEIWAALPVLTGNRVLHPSRVDLEYAKILLAYASNFDKYKQNLKNKPLKFVLTSQLSPVTPFFNRQLNHVIQDTQRRITQYGQLQ